MPPALGMQSLNHWIGREVPEMFSLLAGLHISLLITAGHTLLQGWSLASGDSAPPESASVPTHTGAQHFPPSPFAAATPVSRAPAAPAALQPLRCLGLSSSSSLSSKPALVTALFLSCRC